MSLSNLSIFGIAGIICYILLAVVALWGAFCVVLVWRRIAQKRFRSETQQNQFLEELESRLVRGDFDSAMHMCDGDERAMSQLAQLALANRKMGFAKVQQLLLDRFQRDVLADLEYRLAWVNTVIKSAPMLGLFGTVVGMIGAFATLATAETVEATALAGDINTALYTTAIGLAIAIPLVLCTASIHVRMRKMEDLVAAGLSRFLEVLRAAMERA